MATFRELHLDYVELFKWFEREYPHLAWTRDTDRLRLLLNQDRWGNSCRFGARAAMELIGAILYQMVVR